jgi:hypothetical protein
MIGVCGLIVCALAAAQDMRSTTSAANASTTTSRVAIELPPIPSPVRPKSAVAPSSGVIARDSAVADRFTVCGQSVSYGFEARAGELTLFDLETWGWERGWRSAARVRIVDAGGRVLLEEQRAGPMVYDHLTVFVAPSEGSFRYELTAVEQSFRYRLTRYSSYASHIGDGARALSGENVLSDYLATSAESVRYSIELDAGEEIWIKASNADPAGVAERRSFRPPHLGPGSYGGYLQQGFLVDVSDRGAALVESVRSVLFRAPRKSEYGICVHAQHPTETGGGGRFELELLRRLDKVELSGVVQDFEGVPLNGVRLSFLHGIDRDVVGAVRTSLDGHYSISVPAGVYRAHLEHGQLGALDVEFTLPGARERNFAWPANRDGE